MVDTLALGASARAWGFESLPGHHIEAHCEAVRGGNHKESSVLQYGSPTNCDTGTQMPGSGYHKENRKCAFCL